MRKSARNLIVALSVAAAAAVTASLIVPSVWGTNPQDILKALANAVPPGHLALEYPLDGTVFPPEIPPPAFRWKDSDSRSDLWLVTMEFPDGRGRLNSFARQSGWRPETAVWEDIKKHSLVKPTTVTVVGVNRKRHQSPCPRVVSRSRHPRTRSEPQCSTAK